MLRYSSHPFIFADFDDLIATKYFLRCSIVFALLMTGCASNVSVEAPSIPAPHIDRLPLDIALRIPAEFNNFVHEENVLGREKWSINLGSANAKFFEQLFGYMFDNVIVIGPDDDALEYTFDALIEPKIEGFEFSVPNQSKTDAFSVWIRYRMQIFDSAGNSAASWTVSAYGKSQKEGLGGSKSLQRAAVLAMRDAAALILLQMNKATKIAALADGPLDLSHFETSAMVQDEASNAPTSPAGLFAIGGIDSDSE
jgi:hypothetical protein